MSGDRRILIFAKAPRPGAAKTRLIPLLGAEGAAALQAQLTERTLATASRAAPGAVELCCTPDTGDSFLLSCGERYGMPLSLQAGDDLGARMHNAFGRALAAAHHVIVIGTDCPVLATRHLHEALAALAAGEDAVFAPAEDGGYALIGLARCDARLFAGMPWGEAGVMDETRARLRALGWRWRELETLWDVDRPEDYLRLRDSGLLGSRSIHA